MGKFTSSADKKGMMRQKMMSLKHSFCVILFSITIATANGQPHTLLEKDIRFNPIPSEFGLSHNTITCILEDNEGLLWVGTWAGLIRFDGYSSTIYRAENNPQKLRSDQITSLFQDHHGNVWIGTQMEGLFKLDKSSEIFTQYKKNAHDQSSLSNNNVWCINEDKFGRLWIGTEHGLNRFDENTGKFERFFHDQTDSSSLSISYIKNMFRSKKGTLWIGTSFGLNRMETKTNGDVQFKRYIYHDPEGQGSEHNYIFQIGELTSPEQPCIWYTTAVGLKKLKDDGTIQHFSIKGKPGSYNSLSSLLPVDGHRPFIVTGSDRGLTFFDPVSQNFTRNISVFDSQSNLTNSAITALCMSKNGILWVGTKNGLNQLDTYAKQFDAYPTASFDKTRSVITGITGSSKKGYFVSTLGGGLFRFKDGVFKKLRTSKQKDNDFLNFIQFIHKGDGESIWVGSVGYGLYHINIDDVSAEGNILRYQIFNSSSTPSLRSDFPMSLTVDPMGNTWVGTWHDGISRISPDQTISVYTDSLLHAPIIAMHADAVGNLWIGTSGNGLYCASTKENQFTITKKFNKENTRGSLSSNFIFSIRESSDHKLWLCTQDGLVAFDQAKDVFKRIAVRNLNEKAIISDVLEDRTGRIWLSHSDGISVLDLKDSTYFRHYNKRDQVFSGFTFNNVSFEDDRGNFFFGGCEGINVITPEEFIDNPGVSSARITDVKVFGKSIYDRTKKKETPELALNAGENSITFEFAATAFTAPEKIQYAFKLEGFDNDWQYTNATRRHAIYTNLNHGSYTFLVKASNANGIWASAPVLINIIIAPPWWKTIWAYALYASLSIGILVIFRRITILRIKLKHELDVERLGRENLETLNHAKMQFFTNVSHEFRTPLTLIIGPLQELMQKHQASEDRQRLFIANQNANRLLRLVNELLDFRKAESGNLSIQVEELNVVMLVKSVMTSFESLASSLNIHFTITTSDNTIPLWVDSDLFEKILFNLLSNAFKHAPSNGRVTVVIEEHMKHVEISIEDNGKGIKAAHLEQIFDAFFSYGEDKTKVGTGIGLALTKNLVDLHHGQLIVESEENQFTRFTIIFQKGTEHFGTLASFSGPGSSAPQESTIAVANPEVPGNENIPQLLIVEDNNDVASYLRTMFQNIYLVHEAASGDQGMTMAVNREPDLIISDVIMPVMNGISLCQKIKSDIKTSHIPVILLTARADVNITLEALEAGADDYITKPFNPNILKLKVRNLIHARQVMKQNFQDHKVLTIEPSKVTVTSTDELFLKAALAGVERNMSNPDYGVDELCRDVGMGKTQLYTKLKALTGQSGNEFIRTIRLKRGAQLLEQRQHTIAEITNWVGFTDLQYFRECFRKLFGVTPSEFARSAGGKSGHENKTDDTII